MFNQEQMWDRLVAERVRNIRQTVTKQFNHDIIEPWLAREIKEALVEQSYKLFPCLVRLPYWEESIAVRANIEVFILGDCVEIEFTDGLLDAFYESLKEE